MLFDDSDYWLLNADLSTSIVGIGVSRSFKCGFLQIAHEGTKDPFACSLFNELNSYSRALLLAFHGGSVGNLYTNLDSCLLGFGFYFS